MALLFTIALTGVCLAILVTLADSLVSLWGNEQRTPPRQWAPGLVPVHTQERRVIGMTFVGSERRRARQAAIEAARKLA